jgi:linker histone H1 and H5 family/Williams-Beuren syndrome DDT (WSD), D-TOX E motif
MSLAGGVVPAASTMVQHEDVSESHATMAVVTDVFAPTSSNNEANSISPSHLKAVPSSTSNNMNTAETANVAESPGESTIGPDETADVDAHPEEAAAAAAAAGDDATTGTPSLSSSTPKKKRARPSNGTTGSSGRLTYGDYIQQALEGLKDYRTGSSLPAIMKWISSHHAELLVDVNGQPNAHFKPRLMLALKAGVKQERFAKVKASYKLNKEWKEKERKKSQAAAIKAKLMKLKKVGEDAAQKRTDQTGDDDSNVDDPEKQSLTEEELQKLEAKRQRAIALARAREAAELLAKKRAETLRKRRYPVEDTRLHREDKELSIPAPSHVKSRPTLPYAWSLTVPLADRKKGGRTSTAILQNSKADALDHGSRGVFSDLLQVYHFFRGDVHFCAGGSNSPVEATNKKGKHSNETGDSLGADGPVVAEFRLLHLIYAVDEITNGNAKRSRLFPPLLAHLFCVCLQILLSPPNSETDQDGFVPVLDEVGSIDGRRNAAAQLLRQELHQYLSPALSAGSWSDVCFLYMDAVHRFYTTDASLNPSVVPGLKTDLDYLLHRSDEAVVPMTPGPPSSSMPSGDGEIDERPSDEVNNEATSEGYFGYLGDPRGSLYRAFTKLARLDPWLLSAEEVLALLRALTEDILANHPGIADDLAAREENMHGLLRAKRNADAHFRKVRLAFEGHKRPTKNAAPTEGEDKEASGNSSGEDDDEEGKEKTFKPTATKKQFEAAMKAQEKANDAYEKGIRNLVAKTEPIGFDRKFNAVYCFRHDPEVLYVEDTRDQTGSASHPHSSRRSWHVIEYTSLFDLFAASLDVRGKRENDLHDELLGPAGPHQSLRRFLIDDVKEKATANSRIKEFEKLTETLRFKQAEDSRRSGRLVGRAVEEIEQIESQIRDLERKIRGESVPEVRDYEVLTGLQILRKMDSPNGRYEPRRTRGKAKATDSQKFCSIPCSRLCPTGNIDGTGIVGLMVWELLSVEERCNALTPWERGDMSRSAWIGKAENIVHLWNEMSPVTVGPAVLDGDALPSGRESVGSIASPNKRMKMENSQSPAGTSSSASASQITNLLKQPLLDLEERVAEITNVAVATRDAEIADDNISIDDDGADESKRAILQREWKKLVNRIRKTPTKASSRIRELLMSAIAAARKAHVPEVVGHLKLALLLHNPKTASECKAAAVNVLEQYGGYNEEDDDGADTDEEGDIEAAPTSIAMGESTPVEVLSVLSAEAATLNSSLDGTLDATRNDWIEAVKSCKTLSRISSLASTFCRRATNKLDKIVLEKEALVAAMSSWEKDGERQLRTGKVADKPKSKGPSEVWANVSLTNEIVMARALKPGADGFDEYYPWWPAKKCIPKDPVLATSLAKVNRILVSFIGEMGGLRVVPSNCVRRFTGAKIDSDDELESVSKDIKSQLDDCMAMARRILRATSRST